MGDSIYISVVGGGECTWGASLQCAETLQLSVAKGLTLISFDVYEVLFVFYSFWPWTWRQLRSRLYQDFRLNHIALRLQV